MINKRITILGCMLVALMMSHTASIYAQTTEAWEYSPYRVRVWISLSPSLDLSEESQQEIYRRIVENAEINFGPTWRMDVVRTPEALFGSVLYQIDDLTVDQLLSRELVMVVGKSDAAKDAFALLNPPPPKPPEDPKAKKKTAEELAEEQAKADLEARNASLTSIRTMETAIARLKGINIHPLQNNALQRDIIPYLGKDSWTKFRDLIQEEAKTPEVLYKELESGKTIAALVQKNDAGRYKKVARPIPTRLPWQPEALLRENDKIFLVSVDRVRESIQIKVKELDAFVRRIGEMEACEVPAASDIPRAVANLTRNTFTPVARLEENDFKTATLRVRAAGLVTSDEHPTKIGVGDVLHPYLRRDDLNGNPTILQSIAFTYIAITEPIDTSRYYGAIFTASRGSLSAAKNKRTTRVALRVNPRHTASNLRLGIQRTPGSVVPGAEVYRRTPGDEDLVMVGRTDWRGVLELSGIPAPKILYEPPTKSSNKAISAAKMATVPITEAELNAPPPPPAPPASANPAPAEAATPPASAPASASGDTAQTEPAPSGTDSSAAAGSAANADGDKPEAEKPAEEEVVVEPPKPKKDEVQIKVPLYLYYIKNGDTLLARLPIINGYNPTETADLPDDRRRLQSEAFLKGIQGEVLDLVVRRRILSTRIKKKLEENKLDEAEKLLDELKRVKSYDKLAEQIEAIRRRATSTENGSVTAPALKRIDKMISDTRLMMTKYLQDAVTRELEIELEKKK